MHTLYIHTQHTHTEHTQHTQTRTRTNTHVEFGQVGRRRAWPMRLPRLLVVARVNRAYD